MAGKRVRLIDVAEKAGVSRATASRVLSGVDRNVAPRLTQAVEEAARELGYVPHLSARALRTGHISTVGIVVPTLANPYFVALVDHLSNALEKRGIDLLIADSRNSVKREKSHLIRLSQGKVDALALVPVSYEHSHVGIEAAMKYVRVVQCDRYTRNSQAPAVVLDNDKAMSTLINYFNKIGRTNVVYVGAEIECSSGFERMNAFKKYVGDDSRLIITQSFSTSSGREAAKRLLASHVPCDAIICGADVLALGVHSSLQHKGCRFPDDYALASFDDSELVQLTDPQISSLHHPLEQMAEDTAALLFPSQEKNEHDQLYSYAPTFIERASTQEGCNNEIVLQP